MNFMNCKKYLFFFILLLLTQVTIAQTQISNPHGSTTFCASSQYNFSVSNSILACTFSGWSFSGTWEVVQTNYTQNGDTYTYTLAAKFMSAGTLSASFTCEGIPDRQRTLSVTTTTLAVTAASSAQQVIVGESVTLSALNATTYSWTGAGLVSSTGSPVTAFPPLGTTTYTVTGTANNCTGTASVVVTAIQQPALPALTPSPDLSYCKEIGTANLSSWGQNLSDGNWTGPEISGSVVNIGNLSSGVYNYTYTRTADNATDQIAVTVLQTVAGSVQIAATESCTSASGTLNLINFSGSVLFWERSYNAGNSWSQIPASASSSRAYNENQETWFRATVRNGSCLTEPTQHVSVKPLAPVGGFLSPSQIQVGCNRSTGTLTLGNAQGETFTWEQNSGSGWSAITGASNPYSFDVSVGTSFRVKVERGNCTPAFSSIYSVVTSTQPGTITANHGNSQLCGSAAITLTLSGNVGAVLRWEHSTNNVDWSELANSAGRLVYIHTASAPSNYYRAAVALGNCPTLFSPVQTITIGSPTVAGVVEFAGEEKSAETINGMLTFYPVFTLKSESYNGQIENWWKFEEESSQILFDGTSETIRPVLTKTAGFRAQVKNGNCDALLSGQATMVINKPYAGVHRVLDHEIVVEYVGRDYQLASVDGVGLRDGFSFFANTGQSFFIVIDDNYALPPVNQNYVTEEKILKEGIIQEDETYFLEARERSTSFIYADELGRPVQKVQRRSSPVQKDIIVPITYDAIGRPDKSFLPYIAATSTGHFQNNSVADQEQFYAAPPEKIFASSYPFAVNVYEPSPLNRVIEQGAPGTDWQPGIGRTVKFEFLTNDLADAVKLWILNESGRPETDQNYDAGELFLNVTIDEHGNKVKEFKDKQNLTILKQVQNGLQWVSTYYIYDDFNLLRYVIQPEGVARLSGNPDEIFLDTWAFQYRYDKRKRLVEKRVPGSEWTYMVYDDRDRLVLTQDGNLRSKNQWTFVKYDALNRLVVSGIYTFADPDDATRIITRSDISTKLSTDKFTESYTGKGDFFGYTNTIFPTEGLEVMSVTYFDNYDFIEDYLNTVGKTFTYDKNALEGIEEEPFTFANGLITGQQTRIIDSDNWLKSSTWYNKRYQVIQTLSENNIGGNDRLSMRYDFAGKVLSRSTVHTKSAGAPIVLLEEFQYDHAGRLLAQYHKIDNNPKVNVKLQAYNALGQLVEKNLHLQEDGSFHQSVDYRYNIRGWLTHINNAALSNDGGVTNDEANDFFGFELKYNNALLSGSEAQFNGNISEAFWKSAGSNKQSFQYAYDPLNRLTRAGYRDLDNPVNTGKYDESIGAYDNNGNIGRLKRRNSVSGFMDDLSYTYSGNRLMTVTDAGLKSEGFKDGENAGADYTYDNNGSLTADQNKKIENIAYNFLNLVQSVKKSDTENIEYTYSADGTKLSQTVQEPDKEKTTDYAGQFVYEDGVLQFILHGEGRVTMTHPEPRYEYFLKDHLGNVRVAFTTAKEKQTFVASLDDETEDRKFLRYDNVRKVRDKLFDHTKDATNGDGHAVRLSGGQFEQIGLAKSLQVLPGDKVHAEVYAKYVHPDDAQSWDNVVTTLMNVLLTNTASPGVIDGASYGTNANNLPFQTPDPNDGGGETYSGPKAYLNYIFINKDWDLTNLTLRTVKLSDGPREKGENVDHEKLELDFEATEAGYLYVYLSNDSEEPSEEVFFDDFLIEHEKSSIIQVSDYYPFGLTFNSYKRENSVEQKYTYNGKEQQDELNLGWLDYGARMYMPDIGRWGAIDPLSEVFYPASPYNYVLNNPVNLIDPDGRSAEPVVDEKNKTITINVKIIFYGGDATEENRAAALETINGMWNTNADEDGWRDAGDGWRMKVVAEGEITDEARAEEIAEKNEGNALYSFVRVEKQNEREGVTDEKTGITDHQVSFLRGNSGFWVTRDMKDTTPAHELGHGFGLDPFHVNAEGINKPNTNDRKVTPANLAEVRRNMLSGSTDKSGLLDKLLGEKVLNYGNTTTTIYNKDGSAKTNR
jgi:RHS repeat-associated protein